MTTIFISFPITEPTPNPVSGAEYGHSVALSNDGTCLAIGCPLWDNNGATIDTNAGIIQIYRTTDNGLTWTLQQELKGGNIITDPGPHQNRWGDGLDMSVDGSLIAIGGEGNVVIYEYNNNTSTWEQLGNVIIGKTYFSGIDTVHDLKIIGSASDKTNIFLFFGVSEHDKAFSLQYNDNTNTWQQFGNITGNNNTDFGFSIAIFDNSFVKNGMRLVIGAYTADEQNGTKKSGQVYIYEYDTTSWQQIQVLGDNLEKDDQFGYALSLSTDGHRLVIGAPADFTGTGKVYIYDWDGNLYNLTTSIISPFPNSDFGHSVVIRPGTEKELIAIGADGFETNETGTVFVYKENPVGTWNYFLPFNLSGADNENQRIGSSVELNEEGTLIVSGGEGSSTNYPGGVVYSLQTENEMCLSEDMYVIKMAKN